MKEKLKFQKIHGNGNDFVLINDFSDGIALTIKQITFLCDRRFGIGADGLLMIKPAFEEYDFKMVYYNADGGRVDFCGNGGRCISFAASKILHKDKLNFIADDGPHISFIDQELHKVSLEMIPWKKNKTSNIAPLLTKLNIPFKNFSAFNTGVPHLVIELSEMNKENFSKAPVYEWGKKIRNSNFFFEEGINVNFTIPGLQKNEFYQRTYERGVESETLSCGTGSVAVALFWKKEECIIKTPGGINEVKITDGQNPILTGKVSPVFYGSITI